MATIQDIKRRVRSVSNTRKITKAMEMIAAAKLRRAQSRIVTLRPFADALVELTVRVSKGIQAGSPHPLLAERTPQRACIVLFSGDRGLAGGLNANVLRRALDLEKEWVKDGIEVTWAGVGKKGVGSLQFRRKEVAKAWRGIIEAPTYRDAEDVAEWIVGEFTAEKFDKAVLVYNHFDSAISQTVVVHDLLPLTDELLAEALENIQSRHAATHSGQGRTLGENMREGMKTARHGTNGIDKVGELAGEGLHDAAATLRREGHEHDNHGHQPDWIFEPDTDKLLDRLLPTYVEQAIFRSLLETTASFYGAQMSAMRSASDNAGDIIDQLTLAMNRARQAAITQEILEVVAGADALT